MRLFFKLILISIIAFNLFLPLATYATNSTVGQAIGNTVGMNFTFTPNVPIGDFTGCSFGDGEQSNCLGLYISAWYGFTIGIIGIIATLMIMYAGFKYLTSRGDNKAISDAKDIMISAISAILIAFLSYTILNLVNPKLLIISMPSLPSIVDSSGRDLSKQITASDYGDYNIPEGTIKKDVGATGSGSDINLWDEQNRPAIEKIKQIPGVSKVTTYGGHDNKTGRTGMAADIWCPNNDCDAVAQQLALQSQDLNASYVIWDQKIWNPDPHSQDSRVSAPTNPKGDPINMPVEEWDKMKDRGSDTANHKDHIHISFK